MSGKWCTSSTSTGRPSAWLPAQLAFSMAVPHCWPGSTRDRETEPPHRPDRDRYRSKSNHHLDAKQALSFLGENNRQAQPQACKGDRENGQHSRQRSELYQQQGTHGERSESCLRDEVVVMFAPREPEHYEARQHQPNAAGGYRLEAEFTAPFAPCSIGLAE